MCGDHRGLPVEVTICDFKLRFSFAVRPKDEVWWEALLVPFDGLIECPYLDVVQRGQVIVEQNLLAANQKDSMFDARGESDLAGHVCSGLEITKCDFKLNFVSMAP